MLALMDEELEKILRGARADPADGELLEQAIGRLRRAEERVPADLLDRVVHPPRSFKSQRSFKVVCELPDGTYQELGETPGELAIPAHRHWWVTPQPVKLTKPLVAELVEAEVPGLTFGRSRSVTKLIDKLAALPHLSFLSFESTKTDDETLAALPAFPRLAQLSLSGTKITSLQELPAKTPELVRLNLDNARKAKDLAALADLPNLRRLAASRGPLGLKVLKGLPVLPELTHLGLYGCPFTGKMVEAARRCFPGLVELSVDTKTVLEGPILEEVAGFEGLLALSLRSNELLQPPGVDLTPLLKLSRLRYLSLGWDTLLDSSQLLELTQLTHFVSTDADDVLCEQLARLPRLRRVTLSGRTGLTAAGFASLAQSPTLEQIDLTGWAYTNDEGNYVPVSEEEFQRALEALQGSAVRTLRRNQSAYLLDPAEPLVVEVPQPRGIVVPPETPPAWRPCGPWAILP